MFGHTYSSRHAGRDTQDNLGPGMVPGADASRGEAFAHARDAHLSRRYAGDLRRWSYLVAFVRRVNAFFAGKGAPLSLYHMSLLNPLNAVPLRLACALFGISAGFYHDLIVPLYASSFLSTDLAMTPLVIVPIIDDSNHVAVEGTRSTAKWERPKKKPR